MKTMKSVRFRRRRAVTSIEYAVLMILVVPVVFFGLRLVGRNDAATFCTIAGALGGTPCAHAATAATSPGPGLPPNPPGMTCRNDNFSSYEPGALDFDRQCFDKSGQVVRAGELWMQPAPNGVPVVYAIMTVLVNGEPTGARQFYYSQSYDIVGSNGQTSPDRTVQWQANWIVQHGGASACPIMSLASAEQNSQLVALFGLNSLPSGFAKLVGGGFASCVP